MKAKLGFNFLVGALALTCIVSTGCHKKPVRVTPLLGSKTGPIGGPGQGGIMGEDPNAPKGLDGAGGAGTTPVGFPAGAGHEGWVEHRDALAADIVYFAYDSSAVRDSEKSKLEDIASYLKGNADSALRVEGNCDERGTEEYNRALGERRALAVREYLIRSGVAAERVDTISYGEDKPADTGHSEASWKKNRRGEPVVLTHP
jgi:peptidoglycan-associated lipoprotein